MNSKELFLKLIEDPKKGKIGFCINSTLGFDQEIISTCEIGDFYKITRYLDFELINETTVSYKKLKTCIDKLLDLKIGEVSNIYEKSGLDGLNLSIRINSPYSDTILFNDFHDLGDIPKDHNTKRIFHEVLPIAKELFKEKTTNE